MFFYSVFGRFWVKNVLNTDDFYLVFWTFWDVFGHLKTECFPTPFFWTFLGEKLLKNGRFFISFFKRFWDVFGRLKNEFFSTPFFGRFWVKNVLKRTIFYLRFRTFWDVFGHLKNGCFSTSFFLTFLDVFGMIKGFFTSVFMRFIWTSLEN